MELESLPVIDWELGAKLAGNKREVAEEILTLFITNLPNEFAEIKQLYLAKNYPFLLKHVHKLHGAVCYCGLPRLKSVIGKLETDLKRNIMVSLPSLFHQLETEVTLLLEHYPRPH